MINIIVPITDNVEEFCQFISNITERNEKGIKFYVGISKKLFANFNIKAKNIETIVFSDKSNVEQIINSLHSCKLKKGKLLVVRRPLTDEEFDKLTTSEKDIAVLKKKRRSFATKLRHFIQSIIKRFFSFTYFDDISAICYKENLFDLLSVCSNLSTATRINRYVGLEIEEINVETKPVKKIYNKTKNIFNFLLGTFILLGSIAGVVCISIFCKINVLISLMFILWIFVALCIWLGCLLNFARTIAVGKLHWGKAEKVS
ncbi:MAG: hypothetical protein J6J24_03900 [Clostridia bacterium]|nr:hypothetical protein [Clostridia bacterium]